MNKFINTWAESMSIQELISLRFENRGLMPIDNKNKIYDSIVIDSMLSNLPIPIFIIVKYDNKLYTNQYNLIQYIKSFVDNSIIIEKTSFYLNNIGGKNYKSLSDLEQEKILDFVINCNVLDLKGYKEEVLEKILYRYEV